MTSEIQTKWEVFPPEDHQYTYVVPSEKSSVLSGFTRVEGQFQTYRRLAIAAHYSQEAKRHNSVVNLVWPSCLPVVRDKHGDMVFLYQIIEEIDAALDYGKVRQRMPNLSGGQIASVIGYLRGLAQFNLMGVDIDALEDGDIESSHEFQSTILESMEDDATHVLSVG